MQTSKAEPDFYDCVSVLACVSKTTIEGLSVACTWQTTMSAGRCVWIKLCIGNLLHCPFFCLSVLPVHLSLPTQPPPPTSGRVFFSSLLRALFHCSFVRSGWDSSALCPSLHTPCSAIYRLALQVLQRSRDRGRGATGGQWSDHGSLVHKTNQNVNKEKRLSRGDLLIVPPTECQLWLHLFGLGEKWSGERRAETKAERFRGDGAYTVSGPICLSGSLLSQQVFDCVLDSNALVHPLRIF